MTFEIENYDDGELTELDKIVAAMTPDERERVAAEDLLFSKMVWRICHSYWRSRTIEYGYRWVTKTAKQWLEMFPEFKSWKELAEKLFKLQEHEHVVIIISGGKRLAIRPTAECKEMVKSWEVEPTEAWKWIGED